MYRIVLDKKYGMIALFKMSRNWDDVSAIEALDIGFRYWI